MTPAKRPLSNRSPSPTPERRSLSPAMLHVELEERLAQKSCDTSILHHVFLLLFIIFLSIIMLFGVILMPFLSQFARYMMVAGTTLVFPRRGRDDVAQRQYIFPSVIKPRYRTSRRMGARIIKLQ